MDFKIRSLFLSLIILFLITFTSKATIAAPIINSGHLPVYYGQFPLTGMNAPRGMTSNGTHLFITDTAAGNISIYTLNGQFIKGFGSFGTAVNQFAKPRGITCVNNTLFIADSSNFRIDKYTTDGQYITSWGSSGTGNGQFSFLWDVATDGKYIYATDQINKNIQVFDLNGNFIRKWDTSNLSGENQFGTIYGLTVTHNRVYVPDFTYLNIKVFDTNGNFLFLIPNSYPSKYSFGPLEVITSDANFIYVGGFGNGQISIFNYDGVYQSTYAGSASNQETVADVNGLLAFNSKLYSIDAITDSIKSFVFLTPPQNLKIYSSPLSQSLILNWEAPQFARYIPISSYAIYRSTDGNNFNYYSDSQSQHFTDQAINIGTTYYYKVVAIATNTSVGVSDYSNMASGSLDLNTSSSGGFLPINFSFVFIGLVTLVIVNRKYRRH